MTPTDDVPDWFWTLISDSKQQSELLEAALSTRTLDEIKTFYESYWDLIRELISSREAHSLGYDEEDVLVSSAWVVNHGKEMYDAVYKNPRLFPNPHTVINLKWLTLIIDTCERLYKCHPRW
jgi:hypothetical protein